MPKNFQPLIDELRGIIENSRNGRLSPADEQKGAALFKELVTSGGKPLSSALELLGDLPWFIPVNGALEAWPQLTPAKQRSFFRRSQAVGIGSLKTNASEHRARLA